MISVLNVVLASAISWIGWGVLKRFVLTSSLDNLPGPPSASNLYGNIRDILSYDGWDYHRHILDTYGRAQKLAGPFGSRVFLTYDPTALHHILIKDQPIFDVITGRNRAFLGPGLVAVSGEQHRKQRKMMNPVFSIKHMRDMIPLFYEVTDRLCSSLKTKLRDERQEVDILDWLSRTALELIGQCGMDCSFDSLEGEGNDHPFAQAIKQYVRLASGSFGFVLNPFFPYINKWNLPRLKRFTVEHIPIDRVQKLKGVIDVIYNNSQEIIDKKKSALASNDKAVAAEMMKKKDIISILMRANLEADKSSRLTDEEVSGQISLFLFAATDTTSSALARIIQILSTNMDAQDKLRKEIRDAERNGQLTYDQLVSLPYLDAVCRETLRLFPPASFASTRIAKSDAVVPLSKPIIGKDGKEISEIMIPKGTNIMVSITGFNTNPDVWGADALEWKPERWLSPLPQTLGEVRSPGVYSHLMTFLGGSRACIGFKFSQLEMKVVMATLLSSFKFEMAAGHKITWKMTSVVAPYVDKPDGPQPGLPILMSVASD